MTYRVFISHIHRDHQRHYDTLVQRFNQQGFDWYNASVPYERRHGTDLVLSDAEIEDLIAKEIDACHVVIVIATAGVSRRRWLRWELARAKAKGKPILAVWRRRYDDRISRVALEMADAAVDTWNIASIMRAVRDLAASSMASTPSQAFTQHPSDFSEHDEVVSPGESDDPMASSAELELVPAALPLAPTTWQRWAPETPAFNAETPRSLPVRAPAPEAPRVQIDAVRVATPDAVVPPPITKDDILPEDVNGERLTTRSSARWWQFWKPRDGREARLN